MPNGRLSCQSVEEPRPPRLCRDEIKISLENTNTCTDSLVTALDDEALLLADLLPSEMNYMGKVSTVNTQYWNVGPNWEIQTTQLSQKLPKSEHCSSKMYMIVDANRQNLAESSVKEADGYIKTEFKI